MSLQDWLDNGWLKRHQTDTQEIVNLLNIVDRDLRDADNASLSADWKFGIAYNAALKLCTIILYLQGYRPVNQLAHYRAIMAIKEIPESNWQHYAAYLNACRMQRNILEYDHANTVSVQDAKALITFSKTFQAEVIEYIERHFPKLLQDEKGRCKTS